MNDTQIQELIAFGAQLWQNWLTPKNEGALVLTMRAWRGTVGNLDQKVVEAVMIQLSTERDFPPTPGQLYRECVEFIRKQDPANDMPDTDEAFTEVMDAVRIYGYTRTPNWSHPAIPAAVEAVGGWIEGVCMSENLPALRAHFAQAYNTVSTRMATEAMPPMPILEKLKHTQDDKLPAGMRSIGSSLAELSSGE